MSDIKINPEELQKEINTSKSTNEKVKELKYDIDKKDLKLQSIEKFLECLGSLNSAIANFGEITETDLHTLEIIKGQWMGLDESMASKTLFNVVSDSFNGVKK